MATSQKGAFPWQITIRNRVRAVKAVRAGRAASGAIKAASKVADRETSRTATAIGIRVREAPAGSQVRATAVANRAADNRVVDNRVIRAAGRIANAELDDEGGPGHPGSLYHKL